MKRRDTKPDLFAASAARERRRMAPLADRMRPRTLDEFVGQEHLLGPGRILREIVESGAVQSLILWGPPGTGKTTLAHLVAGAAQHEFVAFSAVLSGAVLAGLLYETVGVGINVRSLELAVTVRTWFSFSAPEVMPVKVTVCRPASSLMLRLEIGFKVGGSLTGTTVIVNVRLTVELTVCESFTVTVIVVVPFAFANGAKVSDPVGLGLV